MSFQCSVSPPHSFEGTDQDVSARPSARRNCRNGPGRWMSRKGLTPSSWQPRLANRKNTGRSLARRSLQTSGVQTSGVRNSVPILKAPRDAHSANNSFVEVGLCLVTSSRKSRNVHLLPWGDLSAGLEPPKSAGAKHDPLARARFYQSLLDNGIVESRAALARHLGVSRARVTQVLKRLETDR